MSEIEERRYCLLNDALFVAYHEAGHAVAANLVDPPRPVQWVRTEVDEHGGSGQTHYEGGVDGPLPYGRDEDVEADRRRAESDAVVSIAGPLSALWYSTGRFRPEHVLAPEARRSLDHCLFDRKDWERVLFISLLLHGFDEERVASWLTDMLERSMALLARPGFLDSVAAVASALVRERCLDGAKVKQLIW
jgi:hypothetical protein